MDTGTKDTHQKALSLNLNPKIYGTIAEIGAGQEVARWFFHVGGAAGTVAKSISAYDMVVSDQLYGKGTRYVSRERVSAMIEREFELLIERLGETRGSDTAFFAFADTVAARNYAGTNECHGWLGLRFQLAAGQPANEILVHVNMLDNTNLLQQQALGVLGINLIYGAFFHRESRRDFLLSLLDGLSPERLEIDTIYCSGPNIGDVDPLNIGCGLIEHGLSPAVLFEKKGALLPPTEAFHNRPLVIVRSALERPLGELQAQLLTAGTAQLSRELGVGKKPPGAFLELNAEIAGGAPAGALREKVTTGLQHADHVLVTTYRENYRLTRYLRRYAPKEQVRFVIGVSSLVLLFQEKYYSELPGRILEGLGQFVADNIKVYVKQMPKREFDNHLAAAAGDRGPSIHVANGENIGLEDLRIDPPLGHLYDYLRSIEVLVSLQQE